MYISVVSRPRWCIGNRVNTARPLLDAARRVAICEKEPLLLLLPPTVTRMLHYLLNLYLQILSVRLMCFFTSTSCHVHIQAYVMCRS